MRIDLVPREPTWGFTVPDGCWLVTLGSCCPPGPLRGVYHGRESPWPMGPCPFEPSLSARFGLFVLTTVQKHVRVPTHSNLAHRFSSSDSRSSCFAPLARPMLPGVKRQHEGGAVTSTPLGWELDDSPHPHIHLVIKGCVCLCLSSPWIAPSFERTGHSPFQTERATFTALRFPVGPVDSGRADSSLPTERRTRPEGPSSAFPSASICFHFDRLTLADLHPVRAITARRLATTPPPPSVPYASIFASHQCGYNGFGVPQFQRRS